MIFNVQRELNYMYKPEFLDIGRSKFEHKKNYYIQQKRLASCDRKSKITKVT